MVHRYEQREGLSRVDEDGPDKRVNVVFVHGLGGGGFSTWDGGEGSETGFWPAAIAKDHPQCTVWTLHYTARISDWNPFARAHTLDIRDRASWFLECLRQAGIASKPIVFVTHSLGGVLVKQALQFAQNLGGSDWRAIWNQTRAIVFLATPHEGSNLADVAARLVEVLGGASVLTRFFMRPSAAIRNLQRNDPTLRYLGNWYLSQVPPQGIDTIAFAEGRPYKGVKVVEESSADPHIPNCPPPVPLADEDHISIAKPAHRDRNVYQRLNSLLGAEEVRDPVPPPPAVDVNTLALRAESRLLAARLWGEWWERHLNKDPAKVSLFSIGPDILIDTIRFDGKGYDERGRNVSKWHSVLARVERDRENNKIRVRYVWSGSYLGSEEESKKEMPFHGYSEFGFDLPADPAKPITRGDGHYWNINQQDPEKSEFRRVEFRRVTDRNLIAKVETETEGEIGARIHKIVSDWR